MSVSHPALHLNSGGVDSLMGISGISQKPLHDPYNLLFSTWLNEQENAYRFLLYETDSSMTPWTRRCLEHADQVLIVGWADHDPTPAGIETEFLQKDALFSNLQSTLVLLHPDDARSPSGTARWLRDRLSAIHHHVYWNKSTDMERLARFLSGAAVGLVLGGGGARGFAHIGVIRALEEAGIPIDMICGVSMGAILAAEYALGYDVHAMLKLTKQGLVEGRLERDFTLPLIAMNSGRRFTGMLKRFCGATRIEDLRLNYFSVSCNLSTAETVVHRAGPLWKAVYAGNAAPGILPPALDKGNLLVDGGIVNNQPGVIMKKLCGGPVIVVNVSPEREMMVDPLYDEMPSAWKILWSRLNPFQQTIQAPGIPAMIMRTILVSSQRKSREVEMNADYYLRPPLDQFNIHDYAKIAEIADIGCRYTRKEIGKWGRGTVNYCKNRK